MNKTNKYLSLLLVGLLTGCQADNLNTVNNSQVKNTASANTNVTNSINNPVKSPIISNEKLSAHGKITSTDTGLNSKNLKFSINYKAIRQGFKTQAIDCGTDNGDDISRIRISISGIGISTTLYPTSSDDTITGIKTIAVANATDPCAVNATVSNVPYGKARVATIESYDSAGNLIPGATVKAVFDVDSDTEDVTVDYQSTPAAKIIESMTVSSPTDPSNFIVSKVNLVELQNKIVAIGAVHPSFINSSAIATDLKANGGNATALVETKTTYKIAPAKIKFTIAGLASDEEATIRVDDPASSVKTVSANAEFTIDNVTPNDTGEKWKIYITPKNDAPYTYTITAPQAPTVPVFPNISATSDQTTDLKTVTLAANRIIYVKYDANGDDTGNTWDNAHTSLQTAMLAANSGDKIWVAKGTYKPTDATTITDTERNISFVIKSGVKIYGGFAGTEPTNYDLTQRDFINNLTILSGDIGTPIVNTDNTNHVVTVTSVSDATNSIDNTITDTTSIDGFTISDGNANLSNDSNGGGMKNSSANNFNISNIIFSNNSSTNLGGGMYSTSSTETLTNVAFNNNTATNSGGGMYSTTSTEILKRVVFSNNTSNIQGGGMYSTSSANTIILTDVIFANNKNILTSGSVSGGGIYLNTSPAILKNVVFYKNESFKGGGMYINSGSGTEIINSTFFENVVTNNTLANGAGILTNNNSPKILNSIFHTVDLLKEQAISLTGNSNLNIGYSYLRGGYAAISRSNTNNTSGNLVKDVSATTAITNEATFKSAGKNESFIVSLIPFVTISPEFVNQNIPAGSDGIYFNSNDGLSLKSTTDYRIKGRIGSPSGGGTTTNGAPTEDITGADRTATAPYSMGAYEVD